MKILVTGANGQLGTDLMLELKRRGHESVGADLPQLDITDGDGVTRFFGEVCPDAVIHCAAWTAVDAAEEDENRDKAYAVNAVGTQNVAAAARRVGAKLMYISTDYVFDGAGETPFKPDSPTGPLSVYGSTKLAGEEAVKRLTDRYFIVRIAWVFGAHGKNFVRTMLRVGKTNPVVRVVCDQIGTPTYTPDLSALLADMIVTDKYGCYHATNEGGYISWYDFAREIFLKAGYDAEVVPVTTAEYGASKAKRPFNSRLDKSKLKENGFTPLPDWRDALARYLTETKSEWDR